MLCCLLIATGAATDTHNPRCYTWQMAFDASDSYQPRCLPDHPPPPDASALRRCHWGCYWHNPDATCRRKCKRSNCEPVAVSAASGGRRCWNSVRACEPVLRTCEPVERSEQGSHDKTYLDASLRARRGKCNASLRASAASLRARRRKCIASLRASAGTLCEPASQCCERVSQSSEASRVFTIKLTLMRACEPVAANAMRACEQVLELCASLRACVANV